MQLVSIDNRCSKTERLQAQPSQRQSKLQNFDLNQEHSQVRIGHYEGR